MVFLVNDHQQLLCQCRNVAEQNQAEPCGPRKKDAERGSETQLEERFLSNAKTERVSPKLPLRKKFGNGFYDKVNAHGIHVQMSHETEAIQAGGQNTPLLQKL